MPSWKAKVVLLGDGAVGKTSLIRRFVLDQFSDDYLTTVGTKVTKKEVPVASGGRETPVVLMIWDVLGQRGYAGVQESAVKGAQAVLVVYDATRDETWKSLEEYWIPIVWRLAGKVPLVVAGNKVDLAADKAYARDVLGYVEQKYNARGFLTSARTRENVDRLFEVLARRIVESAHRPVRRVAEPTPPLRVSDPILGVTDRIMTDFCAGFGGLETAMNVVRQQFEKAGVDVRAPTKEGLLRVVDLLTEVEKSTKDMNVVATNRLRRVSWIRALP